MLDCLADVRDVATAGAVCQSWRRLVGSSLWRNCRSVRVHDNSRAARAGIEFAVARCPCLDEVRHPIYHLVNLETTLTSFEPLTRYEAPRRSR